jgi:mannosyl-oligosaccharide alpha-1,2-mannosidase
LQKYQDQAWEIFQAFESKAKVENGYAIIKDVTCVDCENNWIDLQPSYFLSETLKYLYLIFSPDDLWSLDEFVFTTEAHPIPFEITHQ